MSYAVCVHFSLVPNCSLYTWALSVHVWSMVLMSGGCSTHTALLHCVESKAFRLINSPFLTNCLDSLIHRRNVASLSLFYRYFHTNCSAKLANCMPSSLPRSHCIRLSTSSHTYAIHLSNARINQYLHFFIPYIGKLWNSLTLSVFPPVYDLNSFKIGISRHL